MVVLVLATTLAVIFAGVSTADKQDIRQRYLSENFNLQSTGVVIGNDESAFGTGSVADQNLFSIPVEGIPFCGSHLPSNVSVKHTHAINIEDFPCLKSPRVDEIALRTAAIRYPSEIVYNNTVHDLFPKLSISNMENRLTTLSKFQNRYFLSTQGKEAAEWILREVQYIISNSSASTAKVATFKHTRWPQDSVVATIPGRSESKIIVGAHLDTINVQTLNQIDLRAPGADDDGSGTVSNMEAFRVLLSDPKIAAGEAANTLEFHWYAAEEVGLWGSLDTFDTHCSKNVFVKAMLQQDMTGFANGKMGLVTDHAHQGLTDYMRKLIDAYTSISYSETRCGYACSDHAAATKANYPAAFVFETEVQKHNPDIHTEDNDLDHISYDHMLEYAQLVVGYAYELAFTTL
ncbi:hypothetical protein F5Y19DRAFT_481573 [Xylariaceae sp. FL1651]|nr:hypothetical protein F5Y19DRAFT_481573 [Xylariaceae sp. FL1651]